MSDDKAPEVYLGRPFKVTPEAQAEIVTDHVQELLADLGRQIAEAELNAVERIDRLEHMAHPDKVNDLIREEWQRFNLSVEPIRRQRDYIIKQLATIEALKIPGPIIIVSPPGSRT